MKTVKISKFLQNGWRIIYIERNVPQCVVHTHNKKYERKNT